MTTTKPLFSVALLAAAIAAVPAHAQSPRATFTLPIQAQWGSAVLPAGDYTILTDGGTTTSHILKVQGEGKNVLILAGPFDVAPFSGTGALELRNVDGNYVVTHLNAGFLGRDFSFQVPKTLRTEKGFTAAAYDKLEVPVSGTR